MAKAPKLDPEAQPEGLTGDYELADSDDKPLDPHRGDTVLLQGHDRTYVAIVTGIDEDGNPHLYVFPDVGDPLDPNGREPRSLVSVPYGEETEEQPLIDTWRWI